MMREALAVASWQVLAGHAPARGRDWFDWRYGSGTAGKYRNGGREMPQACSGAATVGGYGCWQGPRLQVLG